MKHLFSIAIVTLILFSCTQKLSEDEYYTKAKNAYASLKYDEAVVNFKGLIENYPNTSRHAEALFMLGFIHANDLKAFDSAKKYYTEFVTKYPNHELADDARYEIETLGKDINELPIFKNATTDSVSTKVN